MAEVAAATPQLNEAFLRQVLRHIETHISEWDQVHWVNETPEVTTYCLAGWAYVLGTGERPFNVGSLTVGFSRPIPQTAMELLGLTPNQADRLFYYQRTPYRHDPNCLTPVTFSDLCRQVYHVTGVRYRPGQVPDAPA